MVVVVSDKNISCLVNKVIDSEDEDIILEFYTDTSEKAAPSFTIDWSDAEQAYLETDCSKKQNETYLANEVGEALYCNSKFPNLSEVKLIKAVKPSGRSNH